MPRATPALATDKLTEGLDRTLRQANIRARAQALGWTLVGGGASVMADVVTKDIALFRQIIAGLHLERT